MLRELADSWLTDCPAPLRRLGHAYAATACAARGRRCARAWAPHRERTKAAIRAAVAASACHRTVLVLGSGPLADVPLADLTGRFGRVVLADAAQPPAARLAAWRARRGAVTLATLDLTGTAAALTDPASTAPPPPGCAAFLDDPGIDLVLSVNLLSQLPLLPLAAALHRWPETDADAYGRAVIAAHLAHLRGFRCPVLLVTDIARTTLDRDGRVVEREDPLFGVSLPAGTVEDWDWELAPAGELPGGRTHRTRVRALRLDTAFP
ncbi:hypothetical protein [Rhodospirillum centenum]|uniref:Class I SAM-dependent methyltransferase n=1 Tax=Rhodospirillum centenum (strain ATCC 51521 / SW) TaxID=414684 RepID=B6IP25_RHOCS|nr:hypothetical protein [Rhodospirillum centenum]ACI99445.1 conserved hypothetical protein [Rhodospirillum centenum SW]